MVFNIEKPYRLIFYLNPDAKYAIQHYTTYTGFFSLDPNAMHRAQYRKALQACLISREKAEGLFYINPRFTLGSFIHI